MIKKLKLSVFFSLIAFNICMYTSLYSEEVINDLTEDVVEQKQEPKDFNFNYDNEPIDTIINQLAALKNLNVILPQGDSLTTKVTLHVENKITLTEAWDILTTLLDVAGFLIIPQESMIRIVKSSKELSREPTPTYIGVSPEDLPNNDQSIRYLYYLANIKISDDPNNELNGILKDILPENAFFKGDSATNSILLIGKANDIRAAMKIIIDLDKVNFQEKVDIIPLLHTSASLVAELINTQLIKSGNTNPYHLDTKKTKEIPYFSGFTKIIPEVRLNKLIILGRPQAISRLKDFIKKYIDIAPDTGKSILHVYQLQYLNARELAPVLERIVQGGGSGGPSQASAGESSKGGIERFFDKVIIHTDSPINEGGDNANNPDKRERFTYYGGNNLVIAARNDDWKQIKKLIEELDTPQKTVLIEVLIADLTVEDSRTLGSMMRTPDKVPLPDSIEFQSAMLGQPIPSELPALPTTTIESDLLSNAYNPDGTLANPSTGGVANIATFAESGTTLLSLNDNDGKTWSIWELLQLFTNSKILSHPHVMARNNNVAVVSIGQTRWLTDKVKDIAGNYYGGATTIQLKPISANLTVKITPRISSASTVNLQVLVEINEFLSDRSNTQTIRKLETNANIKNGGIFALGGLIRTRSATSIREVPFFGRIPILGWFFKNKSNDVIKNNLTVFISPTIIEPRLREGINDYTQDYINVAKHDIHYNLFDSLKDPVTRWFFTQELDTEKAIDEFTAKDVTLPANEVIKKKEYLKKSFNQQRIIDASTDILTHKPDGTVAHNDDNRLNDLKERIENEPNPFIQA